MKIKNCYNEIKTKNMNINILNEKNQLLNSLMSQKNEIIKKLQIEKNNINKNMSNITAKNIELNKILNRKHEDIIQFQTMLIEKEKKIKDLSEYINKLKTQQKENINKQMTPKILNRSKEMIKDKDRDPNKFEERLYYAEKNDTN